MAWADNMELVNELITDTLIGFGETVLYRPLQTGVSVSIDIARTEPSNIQEESNGVVLGISADQSQFDFPPEAGDEVSVGSHTYVVSGQVELDAGGFYNLLLIRA